MIKMKKIFSLLFAMCFILSIVPFSSFADTHDSCLENGHNHKNEFTYVTNFEKEVTVELKSEKDILTYPRNPNYRYTFIISDRINKRAICHKCGRGTLGTAKVQDQKDKVVRGCPIAGPSYLDHMDIWGNYRVERCISCGYSVRIATLADTYTATCFSNPDVDAKVFTVIKGHDPSKGYNDHESYDYWIRGVWL